MASSYDSQADAIRRQRMIAEALRESGNQGIQYAPPSGPRAYKQSAWQGIDSILQKVLGAYAGRQADKQQAALDQQDQANTKRLVDSTDSVEQQGFIRPITDVAGVPNAPAIQQDQQLDTDRTAGMRAAALRGVQFGGTAGPLAGEMLRNQLVPQAKDVRYEDLGDRIAVIRNGAIAGYLPKGATPDAAANREAAQATLRQQQNFTAAQNDLNRGVTLRGQDRLTNEKTQERADKEQEKITDKSATWQKAQDGASQMMGLISQLEKHPGREAATGVGLQKTLTLGNFVPGSDAANFKVLNDQVQSRLFLEAFAALRGGGQISNIEGEKAQSAIGRLSLSQSDTEYMKALQELKGIVSAGLKRARIQAGPATGRPAPKLLKSNSAPASSELPPGFEMDN